MKADPIRTFIIKNPSNLKIAAAVGTAWPKVREDLVATFIKQLEERLLKKLKGWKPEPSDKYTGNSWSSFAVFKPTWADQYYVTLFFDKDGREVSFGVLRDEEHINKRPHNKEVLDAVRAVHPSAKPCSWWEAKTIMRSPATDWGKPETLWRLHSDKKFLDEVAEQILQMAAVVAPIIDRVVHRHRK